VRQNEPYCNDCIEASVQQKARVATKGLGLIAQGDTALLALSGGVGSGVLLHCMCNMHADEGATRAERGKLTFDLTALHMDCSGATSSGSEPSSSSGPPAGGASSSAAAAAAAGTTEPPASADTAGAAAPTGQEQQQAGVTAAAEDEAEEQQHQQHVAQLQQALTDITAAAGLSTQPLLLHLSDVFCDDRQLQALLHAQQAQQQRDQKQQQQQQPEAQQDAAAAQQDDAQEEVAAPPTPEQASDAAANAALKQRQQRRRRRTQLRELLASIADPTGREDMQQHLRELLLLRAAGALGCNRLLQGSCASRLAATVIAEAAKGRGYGLPAEIQFLDARELPRGGPAVLQPLREVTRKELAAVAAYRGIPVMHQQPGSTQPASAAAGGASSSSGSGGAAAHGAASVNALADKFVADMEGSVPASIYTIIRTAAHLEAFSFSDAATMLPAAAEKASRNKQGDGGRQKQQKAQQQQQQQPGGGRGRVGGGGRGAGSSQPTQQQQAQTQAAVQPWQLCSICRAPLPPAPAPEAAAAAPTGAAPSSQAAAAANFSTAKGSEGEAAAAAAAGSGAEAASVQAAAAQSNGSPMAGASCRQLCYSCNRQILQHVMPAQQQQQGEGGGAGSSSSGGGSSSSSGGGSSSQQQALRARQQRLRQMLPPGMLLELDSDDEGEAGNDDEARGDR
jgi:hypothetical protein